jgi:hypothetical protein
MKVEYLIQLFENFNKKIWTNKNFSYFLIIIIIGYTVALRRNPDIYYKYLFNPVILIIVIGCILLIARYNTPLGFMLAVSVIALYYPTSIHREEITENFDDKIKIPIPGEDKNIVDDTKKNKNKNKNKQKTETDSDAEDDESGSADEEEEEEEEEDKKSTEKFKDSDEVKSKKSTEQFKDSDEVKDIGLEKLNPAYYKSNNTKNTKNSKKITTKSSSSKSSSNNKNSTTKPPKKNESFIGDVRNIIQDLDTGKKGMNASSAIKEINNLFYNKHKNNIQKIIAEDDDDESEEDDDFF